MNRKTIYEIVIATTVLVGLAFFHAHVFAGALIAAGRNHLCPLPLAIHSIQASQAQEESAQSMIARSRKLDTDAAAKMEQWETPRGKYWIPSGSAQAVLYDLGEQNRSIYSAYGHGVKRGDVVLDCGANVGTYIRTSLAAGASKVIAIEPAPENLACLRRNFPAEIASGQVVVVEKGVWDKEDVLQMTINPTNSAADSFLANAEGSKTIALPLTTIDKLMEDLHLDRVDFIKMDIEGAERNAVAGAKQTLAKYHPQMALCVYHRQDDPEVIPQAVKAADPKYQYLCGPCLSGSGIIKPEVFFFF